MSMVMAMMFLFLVVGARAERVDRWVIATLVGTISIIVLVTYIRF